MDRRTEILFSYLHWVHFFARSIFSVASRLLYFDDDGKEMKKDEVLELIERTRAYGNQLWNLVAIFERAQSQTGTLIGTLRISITGE